MPLSQHLFKKCLQMRPICVIDLCLTSHNCVSDSARSSTLAVKQNPQKQKKPSKQYTGFANVQCPATLDSYFDA